MLAYLLILALVGGLLMYLLSSNAKVARIGEILFFSAVLALLIALAPATKAYSRTWRRTEFTAGARALPRPTRNPSRAATAV
jgi:Zn-dependent protease with chaperone function